jgi:hypothetical protein
MRNLVRFINTSMLGSSANLRSTPMVKSRVRCEVGKWFEDFISLKAIVAEFFLIPYSCRTWIFAVPEYSFFPCSRGGELSRISSVVSCGRVAQYHNTSVNLEDVWSHNSFKTIWQALSISSPTLI